MINISHADDLSARVAGVCPFVFCAFFFFFFSEFCETEDREKEDSSRVTASKPSTSHQFGDDASARTSPSTTTSAINQNDQKRGWHPLLKFFLSFAFGSLGVMLATAPLSPRWSFTLLDTRIQFRSMFVATLFLFIFLCLGQYSPSPPLSFIFSSPFLFRFPCIRLKANR